NVSGTPTVFGNIDPNTNALWFDTSVFSAPAALTFGNAVRNGVLDGPTYRSVDATLAKLFSFPHGIKGEFRADVFNLFNTPPFDRPNGSFASSTFGQITSVNGSNGGPPDERSMRFGFRITF